MSNPSILAAVVGLSGPRVTAEERALFAGTNPLGFILFARNCVDPDQIASLTEDLRAIVGRADAPILIDQEGGRVQRLKPPHWRRYPPAEQFGLLYHRDPAAGVAAARLNARLIAADLCDIGITVDCAPVVDLRVPGAHDVIGDRAYDGDPEIVAELGKAVIAGLRDGGVVPVIKHIPGHGRAGADSHHALPIVDVDEAELTETDFRPFGLLADQPAWAMTAHVRYSAIDPEHCATVSARIVSRVIRGEIGFDGVLVSDDLSMAALEGDLKRRTVATMAAGCDLVLHCNGNLVELREVLSVAPPVSSETFARLERCTAGLGPEPGFDAAAGYAELNRRLAALRADAAVGQDPTS